MNESLPMTVVLDCMLLIKLCINCVDSGISRGFCGIGNHVWHGQLSLAEHSEQRNEVRESTLSSRKDNPFPQYTVAYFMLFTWLLYCVVLVFCHHCALQQ